MHSEIATRTDFSRLRYGQCWEDADVLLDALDVRAGDRCLSIASAGDNTLALLIRDPARVIAVDLSPAQLAALELRVAAFRALTHAELLELLGSRPSPRRRALYDRCRPLLAPETRHFWDTRPGDVSRGIGGAGKFERYLAFFVRRVLPLVHSRVRIRRLLEGGPHAERVRFWDDNWDTRRWRLLFRIFFSRAVLGRLGRDPAFFTHVEGAVADRLRAAARRAVVAADPRDNPYLQWILAGRHLTALPCSLRPEHWATIRRNLDRLEWRRQSLEDFAATAEPRSIDRFNLSDVFEYVSLGRYRRLVERLTAIGRPGGRLVYWNLLAPRRRPAAMAARLRPLDHLAAALHTRDRVPFYSALVVEEILR
jgi:S-adenosylmethionine-diacylglycerol 3-amino-3-carboxypropyl transferase